MKKKTLPLTTILIIIGVVIPKAQNYEWIAEDFPGSSFLNIIQKDGDLYAVASIGPIVEFIPEFLYQLSIYKIKPEPGTANFELEEIITIPSPDFFATDAVAYINETKRWIIFQTKYLGPYRFLYKAILYDDNFNFISEQTLDTLGLPGSFHISTYQNNTYILGSISSPPKDEIALIHYDHSKPNLLSPIMVGQTNPDELYSITSMTSDEHPGNMLIFHYLGIAILDTNFQLIHNYEYNQIKTNEYGTVLRNGNYYYSHGDDPLANNGYRYLVLHKYDTLFNLLKADTFGTPNQDNYPFLFTSLDVKNNEILVGGHLDGPLSHLNFFNSIKKYYLAKYDTDMNKLWYKEYGGDRAYTMVGLKLTEDGSSYAYGFITDSGSYIRHAYIMRVDANGENLSSFVLQPEAKSYLKVVSPGNSTLIILNSNNIEAQIELYDNQACLVLTKMISESVTEIDASNLPNAIYTYVLLKDRRIIDTGKWLKAW